MPGQGARGDEGQGCWWVAAGVGTFRVWVSELVLAVYARLLCALLPSSPFIFLQMCCVAIGFMA